MNTRATKRTTGTSVFGSSFGGAPTAGASTFGSFTNSGLNADTTPRGGVFDSYSTLFGGRAKQPTAPSQMFGGNPNTPSSPTMGAQSGSLFGSGTTQPTLQSSNPTTSLFATSGPFGSPSEPSKIGVQSAATVQGSSVFGDPSKTSLPSVPQPDPPKSPLLFGMPASSNGTVPVQAPEAVFPQPVAQTSASTQPLFGAAPTSSSIQQPLFGAASNAPSPDVVSLLERLDTLSKKLEASERVVIKYQVVCGVHCHPLTEMSKDELGGPYSNGFTCSRCLQTQTDFSDRYYHCTVCDTDPQKGGVDFCCHCIRSFLSKELVQ